MVKIYKPHDFMMEFDNIYSAWEYIDFCCLCSALLEFIDLKNGEDVQIYSDLSDDIEFALEELLNDYK